MSASPLRPKGRQATTASVGSLQPHSVRDQNGMLSAINVESRPRSPWNPVRHQPGNVSAMAWNTHPGDRFRWRDTDAEVWAQVHGVRDARFSPGSSTDQIPTRTLGFRVPADGPLYAAAINLASHAARAENRSRSRPRSQQPGAPTPRALGFLPGGEQFIDVSTRGIAAVWRGAPATARLSLDGRVIEQTDTGLGWWVRFPVDAATGAYRLELDDPGGLHWAIRRTSPVPAPPWMTDSGPRSDAQRLVRALWILRGDQQTWKLFAISEIATMADDGHFLALQLWRAVLSGEIEDLLP